MNRVLLLLAALCLLPAGISAQESTATPEDLFTIPATIYQTTNLRQGPDTRFPILGRLAEDDQVEVFERESAGSRWLHVITETGTSGWIPSFSAALESGRSLDELPIHESMIPDPGTSADIVVTAYGRVNVRSGPAIENEIVGTLDVGDSAPATARSNTLNDWLYIEHELLEGWVAYFTVQVTGDPNTLPVLVPDAEGEALISPSRVLRARFNIRLHTDPLLESPTIMVIPFNSRVTVLARTENGTWLYVDYDGTAGWGAANLFSTPPDLESLPIYTPGDPLPEVTPEITPEG